MDRFKQMWAEFDRAERRQFVCDTIKDSVGLVCGVTALFGIYTIAWACAGPM